MARRILVSLIVSLFVAAAPANDPSPEVRAGVTIGRVVVKFTDDARVRQRGPGLVSLSGGDLSKLRAVLSAYGYPETRRLFVRDETAIDRGVEEAERRSGRDLADLNGYYEVEVFREQVPELVDALLALEIVQGAYPAPPAVSPPVDVAPPTPDLEAGQGHLDPAPDGIDAREAWTRPGGRGQGVFVIDVEYDWRDTHEDLDAILAQQLCFTPPGEFIEHGTAAMGLLAGGDNAYGTTGIVPDATFGMVTQDPVGLSNSVARAVDCATSLMQPGDVMLLETQTLGPLGGGVPSEWDQAVFDAVSVATALGVTVVAAAGNGGFDLDNGAFEGKFDRDVRDSRAIIVGAGGSPTSAQPPRSRLSFSSYGTRVDLQAWGEDVTSAGYGDLFDAGGDPDQFYTATFSGTSSAAGIVAGAAAALQGVQQARTGVPYDSGVVRHVLAASGTPQQPGPFAGPIGPQPDLLAALGQLPDLFVTEVVVTEDPQLGNGDGFWDPGETAVLRLTVKNYGDTTVTSLQGELAALDDSAVVTRPVADWPPLDPGQSAESLPAHHRVTLDPDAGCAGRVHFVLQLTGVPYAQSFEFDLGLGGEASAERDSADVPRVIPAADPAGVVSVLSVPDALTIADINVSVEIRHDDIGELRVVLHSPSSTAVTLHDHSSPGRTDLVVNYDLSATPDGPGVMDDFDGESALGDWLLVVADDTGGPTPPGTLEAWSLAIDSTCNPFGCAEPVPNEMGDSFRADRSGQADLLFAWLPEPGVSAYRVWRSGTPGFEDERLVGQTAAAELLHPEGVADPGTLVFYQLRAVNICEWQGP